MDVIVNNKPMLLPRDIMLVTPTLPTNISMKACFLNMSVLIVLRFGNKVIDLSQ